MLVWSIIPKYSRDLVDVTHDVRRQIEEVQYQRTVNLPGSIFYYLCNITVPLFFYYTYSDNCLKPVQGICLILKKKTVIESTVFKNRNTAWPCLFIISHYDIL